MPVDEHGKTKEYMGATIRSLFSHPKSMCIMFFVDCPSHTKSHYAVLLASKAAFSTLNTLINLLHIYGIPTFAGGLPV